MNFKKIAAAALSAVLAVNAAVFTVFADKTTEYKTKDQKEVEATGQYFHWDGVTTVCQFVGMNGELSFAYVDGKNVVVVNTKGGKTMKNRIKLQMQHDIFGTVICDKNYYYVVTGQENNGTNTRTETIFVSKYDKDGNHIKTVGDNGSSSLPLGYDSGGYYYDSSCCTKIPFDSGCCDAAINGNLLSVNYARQMYNGHQSNSVFTIDTNTMEEMVMPIIVYNSHSFGQRVVPYKKGFVYLSEGDGYPRAFNIEILSGFSYTDEDEDQNKNIFHFWLKSGSSNNMFVLNNNFAHTGGIVNINDKKIAMVGTSAKSLNSNAQKETEQLFIQIFDPTADLSKPSAYVTSGTRSGKSGLTGNESVTDYGVMWLTNYGESAEIFEPQIVLTDKNEIVVLYEKCIIPKSTGIYEYAGVYYTVLDENGKILKKETLFSKTAQLNSCEMPVFANGKVCWVGNTISDEENVYIFSLKLE